MADINDLIIALQNVPADKFGRANLYCQQEAVFRTHIDDPFNISGRLYKVLTTELEDNISKESVWVSLYRDAVVAADKAKAAERKANSHRVRLVRDADKITRKRREAQQRPRALAQLHTYQRKENVADKKITDYEPVYQGIAKSLVFATARVRIIELAHKQDENAAVAVTGVVVSLLSRSEASALIQQQVNYIKGLI